MKKIGLIVLTLFSVNSFASSLDTAWSEVTKIVSISAYSEVSTDQVSITFQSGTIKINPANCSKSDMFILHTSDTANSVGKSLMSMALTAGAANLQVKFKVHTSACKIRRPIISELKIIFN